MNVQRKPTILALALALALALTMLAGVGSPAVADNIGNEGCTPGYWKNHTDNWQEQTPNTQLDWVFDFPASLASFRDDTFLEALNYGGGGGLEGATRTLMRAGVAAWLNAAHEGLGYPLRRFGDPGQLQARINAALASEDRATILALAEELDELNNLGCPLN